jgi:hypothetical protein
LLGHHNATWLEARKFEKLNMLFNDLLEVVSKPIPASRIATIENILGTDVDFESIGKISSGVGILAQFLSLIIKSAAQLSQKYKHQKV